MKMRKIYEALKCFFTRDWTLAEKILVVACCLLTGVLYGFLLAPVKKGISCLNNNGSHFGGSGKAYDSLDDGFWLDDED